jgi:hypothetical protein
MTSIITPPDFVSDFVHTVLIIDPEQSELEAIALFCASTDTDFNIYVYLTGMEDTDWLSSAIKKASQVIVNTINTELSVIKDAIAVNPAVMYYGPKRFLMNHNRIEHPLEYFTNYE